MSRSASQIEYHASSAASRRRQFARQLRHVTIAALLVFLATWYGPRAAQRAARLFWQHQCMNYDAPPGTVIYDPAHPDAKTVVAAPWAALEDRGFGTLFVHRRSRRDGTERLVVVELIERLDRITNQMRLDAVGTAFEPASLGSEMRELGFESKNTNVAVLFGNEWEQLLSYKLFAGQPDAQDPSRFTIPCEGPDGRRCVIEGWLSGNDLVCLNFPSAEEEAKRSVPTSRPQARASD